MKMGFRLNDGDASIHQRDEDGSLLRLLLDYPPGDSLMGRSHGKGVVSQGMNWQRVKLDASKMDPRNLAVLSEKLSREELWEMMDRFEKLGKRQKKVRELKSIPVMLWHGVKSPEKVVRYLQSLPGFYGVPPEKCRLPRVSREAFPFLGKGGGGLFLLRTGVFDLAGMRGNPIR